MQCPQCANMDSKVVDSRGVSTGIRRRRECLQCGFRFTTYERIQTNGIQVIKKDGRREEFDRDKLTAGLRKACTKRPIHEETIQQIVDDIEQSIHEMGKMQAPGSVIGEMVMEALEPLDRVAYIRFASVYRDFADIETFKREVDALIQSKEADHISAKPPLIPEGESVDYTRADY